MQVQAQHRLHRLRQRPISGKPAGCIPGKVQTVGGISHTPRSERPEASANLGDRQIAIWQTVPISVDQQAGLYRADTAIFSNGRTVLPYGQLVEIAGFLEQNEPNNPNTQSHRVASKPSPIHGAGVFAQRAYQEGEIIGFYTGRLVLRKPMPTRLYSRYKKLTGKRWKDIALPLYCIWHQNRAGDVEYQTTADTYTAWSQVKIFSKNIELGIDGKHSGNPMRLLNHSYKPNTAPLPTVNPKMLKHIRADGQTYVTDDVDLEHCLLVPVLARREIAKGEELTFHYRGYGGYPGYYCSFDDMGRNIVSNPAALMTWKRGEFPEFIKKKEYHVPKNPRTNPRPTSQGPISSPLPGPELMPDQLCIPLSPFRLDKESDQEFAERLDQLVNRSEKTITMAMDTSNPDFLSSDPGSGPKSGPTSDGEERGSIIDSDSDVEPLEPGDDQITAPVEALCLSRDVPTEQRSSGERGARVQEQPDNHSNSSQLLQKRPAPAQSGQDSKRYRTPNAQSHVLYRRLQTASPSEQPEIIWHLICAYQRIYDTPLVNEYHWLCNALNRLAIPHNIEGEEPEWTPALAYQYLSNHGYINGQSDLEQCRLMPVAVLKEWVTHSQDDSTPNLFKPFCLAWLRDHQFRCGQLVFLLNLYGFKQHNGRQWDLPAIYHFINAHPLSDQEFNDWLATIQNTKALGIGLWNLIRAGQEKAFHALIKSYAADARTKIDDITSEINKGFEMDKGIFNIDTPLATANLFQYIVKHDIVDLDDPEIFRILVPRNIEDVASLLTPAEKQKLVWQGTEPNSAELTFDQIKEKLLRDFITDMPAQRDQNLARNLLKLYQTKKARYQKSQRIYTPLVTLLNHHGVHKDVSIIWNEQTIYDFWLSNNVLDETTRYDVMNFKILANRLTQSDNPKKELAHFFHHFIETRSPAHCLYRLRKNGITNKEIPQTVDGVFRIMTEYNLPVPKKCLSQPDPHSTVKKFTPRLRVDGLPKRTRENDLAWRIRDNADKEALKNYIENWLSNCYNNNRTPLNRLASNIREILIRADRKNKEELLKPFVAAFHAEVWNLEGLLKFIIDEGILDFSNPQSFFYLSPAEAGQVLPNVHCLDYANYAISQGMPARFISCWEKRCQKDSPGFSPSAFYGELARHLVSHPPAFPYTLGQIKNAYNCVAPQEAHELKSLLLLKILQFQTAHDCKQTPDSLLIFVGLLRSAILSNASKVIGDLQSYQIKIPQAAESIPPKISSQNLLKRGADQGLGGVQANLLGRAVTTNWITANLKKLLFLHDQKFTNGPRLSEDRQRLTLPASGSEPYR